MDDPADRPVTTPLPLTVATAVLDELHIPPVAVSERAVVFRMQTVVVPVIAGTTGNGLTLTSTLADAVHPVAGVVTVTVYRPAAAVVIAAVIADPPVVFH
jgi:hypothetical protein